MIPSAQNHNFQANPLGPLPVGLPPVAPRSFQSQPLPLPVSTDQARPDLQSARGWFLLSVASLLLAGVFALLLVVGRIPAAAPFITDPGFFQRCLVVHVNLSLLVWFSAFAVAMFRFLPVTPAHRPRFGILALPAAVGGVLAMMAAAFLPHAPPILSNYIPFIDHPLFAVGVILFLAGLVLAYLDRRLWVHHPAAPDSPLRTETAPGLRACAIATLIAVVTFGAAWAATPSTLGPEAFYELVAWGGGHVLQVANVAAMVTIWLILLHNLQGRPVASTKTVAILFALLVAPHMVAPLLTVEGTLTLLYHRGSTQLMRFGIFPVVTIFLILCIRRLVEARSNGRLPAGFWKTSAFAGFSLSAAMTVIGFILGAMIRSSNTMIPAHYHASIGAVTVAFMAMAFVLLVPFGYGIRSPRLQKLIPWQLALFGIGQLIFALGFAVGGVYGLDRKAYGSDQHVASLGEHLGLAIMGIGGLVAVAGGGLFLALMIAAWGRRPIRNFLTTIKLKPSA